MKQIIIVHPNSLDKATKQRLTKANVILIEHENPDSVRIINPTTDIYTNDVMMSALKGANQSSAGQSSFTRELEKRLLEKENKPTTQNKQL